MCVRVRTLNGWACMCVHHAFIWASRTSPSLTATQLRQHSPPSAPSHVKVCVRDAEKWSVCMFQLWTKAERRWSPEKPEKEVERWGGGDSFKGRLRGHISEKVEWDIWKRERESLGQGGNCSCPTMIHWGKFSSTSPSPPSHLSLRTTPHSGWSITMRKMRPKHLQFYISCVSSKTLRRFCTDWYFDTDARPFSLSRDLSMNNISEIQSRAFHRLHLLSELWVKSFSSHSIDKPPSAQLTHDKKQLFPEPPISSVMGIDDSGLLLISPAKKQPAAMASRSWDGCTKEGEGGWTW